MDIPSKVLVTSPQFGINKQDGTLIAVSPNGYYEVNVLVGSNTHAMLLPIGFTSLMASEPVLTTPAGFELER